MSMRRTGKLLSLVGFVVCLSLLGIMYGNLATVTEERDHIITKKNEFRQEIEELQSIVSGLRGKVSTLETTVSQCNADKLKEEENSSLLRDDLAAVRSELEKQNSGIDSLRDDKEYEIQNLKSRISDLELEVSGNQESSSSCVSSNENLQERLSTTSKRMVYLEGRFADCVREKKAIVAAAAAENKDIKDTGDNVISEDTKIEIVPVAAVPAPDPNNPAAAPAPADNNVADIPEAPRDSVIDNNRDIPDAQAPAPPVAVESKRDAGDNNIPIPLQPVPNNNLEQAFEKVQQEQLQERQDQMHAQPGEPAANPAPQEPQLPPEMRPAEPAPNLHHNEDDNEDDNEDNSVTGSNDNVNNIPNIANGQPLLPPDIVPQDGPGNLL